MPQLIPEMEVSVWKPYESSSAEDEVQQDGTHPGPQLLGVLAGLLLQQHQFCGLLLSQLAVVRWCSSGEGAAVMS